MTNAQPPEGSEPAVPAAVDDAPVPVTPAPEPVAEPAIETTQPAPEPAPVPTAEPTVEATESAPEPTPEPAAEPTVEASESAPEPAPVPAEAAAEPTPEPPAEATEAPAEPISPLQVAALAQASFEVLGAELAALGVKVAANEIPFKQANAELERIRGVIAASPAVGVPEELSAQLAAVEEALKAAAEAHRAARAAAAAAARTTKDRIVAEAETIAAGSQWRVGGERLATLLEEWKSCARLDRKSDDELWKRFSAARSAFAKRRKVHYHELAHDRDSARGVKEQLAEQAEALASSTDWAATASSFRDLMAQWKSAGRAGRDVDDALWARFRAAQDVFFAARNAAMGARDSEQSTNLAAKQALCTEAEALLPITDVRSARAALRSIQERWEAIGHVPREARSAVESRLAAVESAIRGADESARARSNPAGSSRAQETVNALREAIATLEAKAAKATAAGDQRRAKEAAEAAAARREWLVEAERTLAELS